MRIYRRKPEFDYEFPEDMKLILDYLNKHGEVCISNSGIEKLYSKFSEEVYWAGWMKVNERILKEFENWLVNYDLVKSIEVAKSNNI